MSRSARVFLVLSLLAVARPLRAQDGTLQRVRDGVYGERETKPERKSSCEDGEEDSLLGELFGPLMAYTLAAPFVLPHRALGDDFDNSAGFLRHPYAAGMPGALFIEDIEKLLDETKQGRAERPPLRPWSVRLAVEEGNDFDGLNRLTWHLLLDTATRFGVRTSWSWFDERLGGGRRDDLILGDVNLVVRFAQSERAEFRAGLGGRVLVDRDRSRGGFNFTYGADVFPARPVILSMVLDAGTLGSAGVFHVRGTAGVNWRHWELYVGYDYLRVGAADLQGPVAGLRAWF